jgi:catechol 2,3-dioxygenase-like lactoylglutathione lyase family enzyme
MALAAAQQTYDVGGVLLARPFKVRRLGHTGFNCLRLEECLNFYTQDLGIRISDRIDFAQRLADPSVLDGMGDSGGYFMRHGTDHHSFVLFNKRVREYLVTHRRFAPGVTVNQISWQVGSLAEVVNGGDWIAERGLEIQRSGRDMPGSNWHTYFYDPDGHTNELFYGMEQIGWDWKSKPDAMHARGFRVKPGLPQIGERDEVEQAKAQGIDLNAGSAITDPLPSKYDVEGILLPRPFKISRIGPLHLFVKDLDAATDFYRDTMGFVVSEEVVWRGKRCIFLRAGTEHHSVGLYPIELREVLGLRDDTTTMSLGMHIASYRQLHNARTFLRERGAKLIDIPSELYPGIHHAVHVLDPDGHAITLYFGMDQLASSDPYAGEAFLGPLG